MNTSLTVRKTADTGYIPVMYRCIEITPGSAANATYCILMTVRTGWDTLAHYQAWQSHKNYYPLNGVNQSTVIPIADVGGATNGKDWFINSLTTPYYVWYSNGGGANPSPPGKTAVPVTYVNGDSAATMATKTKTALDAIAGAPFTTTIVGGSTLVITLNNVPSRSLISPVVTDGTVPTGYAFQVYPTTTTSYNPLGPVNPPQGPYARLQGHETDSETGIVGTVGTLEVTTLDLLAIYRVQTPSRDS